MRSVAGGCRARHVGEAASLLPLTDNRLELTVRFIVREHGIRELEDAIARAVLAKFESASIPIASATYEIARVPALRIHHITDAW